MTEQPYQMHYYGRANLTEADKAWQFALIQTLQSWVNKSVDAHNGHPIDRVSILTNAAAFDVIRAYKTCGCYSCANATRDFAAMFRRIADDLDHLADGGGHA